MTIAANTVEEYLDQVPVERQEAFYTLRDTIKASLPGGFEECLNYKMIGYVVPHSLYPSGYHCDPKLPLPFINLANQKNFIGFYHMGIYADLKLMTWFQDEYAKRCKYKLDMGKSCLRLKKMDDIPFELIGQLCQKLTPEEWIKTYESAIKR